MDSLPKHLVFEDTDDGVVLKGEWVDRVSFSGNLIKNSPHMWIEGNYIHISVENGRAVYSITSIWEGEPNSIYTAELAYSELDDLDDG